MWSNRGLGAECHTTMEYKRFKLLFYTFLLSVNYQATQNELKSHENLNKMTMIYHPVSLPQLSAISPTQSRFLIKFPNYGCRGLCRGLSELAYNSKYSISTSCTSLAHSPINNVIRDKSETIHFLSERTRLTAVVDGRLTRTGTKGAYRHHRRAI